MGLDDIDEDDGPIAPPQATQPLQSQPGAAKPAGGNTLDDLFGGIPTTNVPQQPVAPAPAQSQPMAFGGASSQPIPAAGAAKPAGGGDFLDGLFGGPAGGSPSPMSGGNSASGTPSAPAPLWGTATPPPANTGFPMAGGAQSATPPSAIFQGMAQPQQQQAPAVDLLDLNAGATRKQHHRSAADFLDGFEAKSKGKSWAGGADQGPKLSEMRGGTTSYTALAANPHLMQLMNFYDLLGVAQNAPEEEIRKAYKTKAIALHPDKLVAQGKTVTDNERELFKTLTKAHETLTDAQTRQQYDMSLKGQAAQQAQNANWLSHLN